MLRTAYVGFLDPITRTHLTNFQGKNTKPETLKQEILRFVSNAVVGHNAMDIGSFEDDGGSGVPHGDVGSYPESEGTAEDWGYYEEVNSMGYKAVIGNRQERAKVKEKEKAKEKETR